MLLCVSMSIATCDDKGKSHRKKTLSDMITTYAFAELWTNFVLSQHVLINFIGHVVVVVVVVVWWVRLCLLLVCYFVCFAFCCCSPENENIGLLICCLFLLIVDLLLFSNLSQISSGW